MGLLKSFLARFIEKMTLPPKFVRIDMAHLVMLGFLFFDIERLLFLVDPIWSKSCCLWNKYTFFIFIFGLYFMYFLRWTLWHSNSLYLDFPFIAWHEILRSMNKTIYFIGLKRLLTNLFNHMLPISIEFIIISLLFVIFWCIHCTFWEMLTS